MQVGLPTLCARGLPPAWHRRTPPLRCALQQAGLPKSTPVFLTSRFDKRVVYKRAAAMLDASSVLAAST